MDSSLWALQSIQETFQKSCSLGLRGNRLGYSMG
jgi:hypothetical protein